jgi:acetyltransferase-like isoleucine patch superfamily enzyme
MNSESSNFKVNEAAGPNRKSAFVLYRVLNYGDQGMGTIIKAELLTLLVGGMPGALGLILRKWFYPGLFKQCGRGVIFGRNLTLRHAHKITLGDHVIVDDNVVLDAKGDTNTGITIGPGVYIGRNTIIYCKNGDIEIADNVNISSNCQIFSSNKLSIGRDTVIAAFTYLLSGGTYDYRDATPFAQQSGMNTRGPTTIGANCWLGAGVVVVDGVTVGEHCVIAAGAVVTKDLPGNCMAGGLPASVMKQF